MRDNRTEGSMKVLKDELQEQLEWYVQYASEEEYDEKAVDSILYLLDRCNPLEEGIVPPVDEAWERFKRGMYNGELLPLDGCGGQDSMGTVGLAEKAGALAGKKAEGAKRVLKAGQVPEMERLLEVVQVSGAEPLLESVQVSEVEPLLESVQVLEVEPLLESVQVSEVEPLVKIERESEAEWLPDAGQAKKMGALLNVGQASGEEPLVKTVQELKAGQLLETGQEPEEGKLLKTGQEPREGQLLKTEQESKEGQLSKFGQKDMQENELEKEDSLQIEKIVKRDEVGNALYEEADVSEKPESVGSDGHVGGKKGGKLAKFASHHKIIAAAVLLMVVLMVGNTIHAVANPETGFFFWLKRDDSGIKMMTSPEELDDRTNRNICIYYKHDNIPEWVKAWIELEAESEIKTKDGYEVGYYEVSELDNRQHVATHYINESLDNEVVVGVWIYADKVSYGREGFIGYTYVEAYDANTVQMDIYSREEVSGKTYYIGCFYDENCKYYVKGQDNLEWVKVLVELYWNRIKNF